MKTILYLAMSVNGLIAGENDEAPWSDVIWDSYIDAVNAAGNLIVGRRTYEIMKKSGDFDSFTITPLCVVVTSSPITDAAIIQVASPAEAVEAVKEKGFNRALIGGGSQLATSFLQANLVDEIQLDIEPLLLGEGTSLLQECDLQQKLKLIELRQIGDQTVHLAYAVEKEVPNA